MHVNKIENSNLPFSSKIFLNCGIFLALSSFTLECLAILPLYSAALFGCTGFLIFTPLALACYKNSLIKRTQTLAKNGSQVILTPKMLKEEYYQIFAQRKAFPLFGESQYSPEKFNFLMPGIAVMATILQEKHHLSNLWVCQTHASLQKKLLEIQEDQDNQRHALIVCTHSSTDSPGHKKSEIFIQHCFSIGIEKVNGHMHIYVLEIMVTPENSITLSQINLDESQPFTEIELILAYINAASLKPETTTIYNTTKQREFGWGGCSTFALKDAVYFLRDSDFTKKLVISKEAPQLLPQSRIPMRNIDALPPECMQLTESSSILNKYIDDFPDIANQTFGPKQKTLQKSMNRHFVMKDNGRKQNTKIYQTVLRYHKTVITQMQQKSDAELNALIQKTLLK